jgi:hypothetical protein
MSIDLDQLTALEQAATPGEWHVVPGSPGGLVWVIKNDVGRGVAAYTTAADAALIAAMRNALPELIERVRAAEIRCTSRTVSVPCCPTTRTRHEHL